METIEEVKEFVRTLDLGPETHPTFMSACILAGWPNTSGNPDYISKLTGWDEDFVCQIVGRLKKNGIFKGDNQLICDWEKEETGGIGFIMDAMVGSGEFIRSKKDGKFAYQMTSEGKSQVERLLK